MPYQSIAEHRLFYNYPVHIFFRDERKYEIPIVFEMPAHSKDFH